MEEAALETEIHLNDTREAILRDLLSEDYSAIELEERLGINESAIRRHLDILEQRGYVEHYFEKANRGRPKKRYKITVEGRNVFPQRTPMLFTFLAENVRERYGEEELREMFSAVASNFAEELASDIEEDERLEKVVRSFHEFGFYASLEEKDGKYVIHYENCVFGEVLEDVGDVLCDLHEEIVANVFPDYRVEKAKTLARGDSTCVDKLVVEGA